jgi:beta-exotoxin I transport system permease protein
MNKNLFTKELKRNRKNLMIWTTIVVGFTVMVLSIFPFMADMGKDMTQLIDNMPVELQKAMGMDAQTWSNILGFYSTYFGIYIVVLVAIYTTSTGATIISKEEKDGTSEFLMTKPISRLTIFKTKMMSLLVLTILIYVIQTLSAIIGISAFAQSEVLWSKLATMQISGFFLVLFFTSIGVLLSMFVKPKKNFMGIVVGLTFGSYFLNAIAKSTDATSWLGYFSPFNYVDFTVLASDYEINYMAIIGFVLIAAVLLFIAFKSYAKKDIAG